MRTCGSKPGKCATYESNTWKGKLNSHHDLNASPEVLNANYSHQLKGGRLLAGGIKASQQNTSRAVRLRSSQTPYSLRASFSSCHNASRAVGLSRQRVPLIEHLLSLLKPLSHKGINDLGGNCSGPLTRLHMYNITST